MELNFIYEQMKDENKIYEMKDGGLTKRSSRDFTLEKKRKSIINNLQSVNNSNSYVASTINITNPNPTLFIKLKNENTEEIYVHYKNFINRLKLSEFYL